MKQADKDALIAQLAQNPHVVTDLVGTLKRIVEALPCAQRKKAKAATRKRLAKSPPTTSEPK